MEPTRVLRKADTLSVIEKLVLGEGRRVLALGAATKLDCINDLAPGRQLDMLAVYRCCVGSYRPKIVVRVLQPPRLTNLYCIHRDDANDGEERALHTPTPKCRLGCLARFCLVHFTPIG
jgi:hypothetical protein